MRWQLCQTSTPGNATWPQRKRAAKEHSLEKRSGEGVEDSRIQVQGWRKMEVAAQNRAKYGSEKGP